jgi:hypothetical protein
VAGDLSKVDGEALAERFGRFPARQDPPPAEPAPRVERRVLVERRDSNQSHLRLHWRPAIDPADLAERAALTVYSTLRPERARAQFEQRGLRQVPGQSKRH